MASILEITTTTRGYAGWDACTRDRQLALDRDSGAVTLAQRITVRDEVGRCNRRDREIVTDRIWAKKDFVIPDPRVEGATLALRVSSALEDGAEAEGDVRHFSDTRGACLLIEVNGHTVRFPWPSERTYWQGTAFAVPIPPAYLRAGLNEFILHSVDATPWYLLIEESLWPNRSARSEDGGRSWDYDHLGPTGSHDGEYLLRLDLVGYPPQGAMVSPPIDLATLLSDSPVGAPLTLRRLSLAAEADTPPGTTVTLEARLGLTPSYAPLEWTGWLGPDALEALPRGPYRFVQWRATLHSVSARRTPRLMAVTLRAAVQPQAATPADRYAVCVDQAPCLARSSYPFAYQPYDEPRVHVARERWGLEGVVAGAANELEALARLADWTRHSWEDGWHIHSRLPGGELRYCPPWDGLVIRELASRGLSQGMCTHYSTVFVQAATALGFVARHNVIHAHCVAEVFVNDWGKWVMFDAGCDTDDVRKFTYHLERDGVPMSALEAHQAWVAKDLAGVQMVPAVDDPHFALDPWLRHFERFCTTLREDDLTTLSPGEPEHGWISYHFDGYLWWEDAQTPKLPRFALATDRVADMYWSVNQVEVHLLAGSSAGSLNVLLATPTPNLDHLEVCLDDGDWRPSPAAFEWRLHRGENRLAARSVNRFGRSGPVAAIVATG